MNILTQLSVWLSFQLSLIFILGIPLTLFCWSIKNKSKAITKLLSNYWKISLLFFISLILLIGEFKFALLITNISIIIMTTSVWFWNDINDELNEFRISNALTTTTKVWRWSLTFISLIFIIQSFKNIDCISFINSSECEIWLKPSTNLYLILNNIFNFLFGASFSQPVAKFLGLFALLIYVLGLVQWAIIKLPKSGRNSGFSNYGRD
ncbi:DUF3177 family protein [Prochlorococcus sp. AH-716-K03]|nr:DUF3177 family protein [Prochlorococcus sp. AH-716-K03]